MRKVNFGKIYLNYNISYLVLKMKLQLLRIMEEKYWIAFMVLTTKFKDDDKEVNKCVKRFALYGLVYDKNKKTRMFLSILPCQKEELYISTWIVLFAY